MAPTFKLQKFAHFSDELRPFDLPKKTGGTCILVDASFSMNERLRELNTVMDDLRRKCDKTSVEMPNPVPNGPTALADSAFKFAKGLKTATFLVVTDGDDNVSHRHFKYDRPKNYKKTWKVVNGRYRPSQRWLTDKREAVLAFLEDTLKAKIVLLGMGDGARKLIRAASRKGRRINCAYVADGDTDADIGRIMDAACDEAARKGRDQIRVITSRSVNGEANDEFWEEEDDMDGFLDDEEEAVSSEDEDEDEAEDDAEEKESDVDSEDLCDDDSDDDEVPASKKRAAPARAAPARAKRANRAEATSYAEDSNDSDSESGD